MPVIFSINDRDGASSYLSSIQYPNLLLSMGPFNWLGNFEYPKEQIVSIYIIVHKSSYRHKATHFPCKQPNSRDILKKPLHLLNVIGYNATIL
jgi:hypothetical protein